MDLHILIPTSIPTPSLALRPSLTLIPSTKPTLSFKKPHPFYFPFPSLPANSRTSISVLSSIETAPSSPHFAPSCTRWVVVMEKPQVAGSSKPEIIDYYVQTLARVIGSEKAAQACIYDASWQTHFGFCCDVDEESSKELSRMPGVLLVRPDKDPEWAKKDYTYSNPLLGLQTKVDVPSSRFSASVVNYDYWIVRMEKPGVEVVTKAQMVDYYAQTLMKVMGNEKDAQVSIYNISWEKDFGFCCQIGQDCARELADVPGVLFVRPDVNFESANKDYKGDGTLQRSADSSGSLESSQPPEIKTKRLFVTGLSFYTSEKTLRAAFEGFGELVEVKIIMDKISKRSKGYAFIEYTTEDAAGAALKEMNGKVPKTPFSWIYPLFFTTMSVSWMSASVVPASLVPEGQGDLWKTGLGEEYRLECTYPRVFKGFLTHNPA